jgi:hypothetical protein
MHSKGRGRKWSWPNSQYYPGISMERLMKDTKNLSRERQSLCRGLNPDSILRRKKAIHSTPMAGPTNLNLGLDGTEWSPSRSGRFALTERTPCTHRTGDWVVLRVRLNITKTRSSGRNQSPYFRVRVTLRLAVYRESVRLGAKPLETHDQRFFFGGNSPYVTSSLTRKWDCLL